MAKKAGRFGSDDAVTFKKNVESFWSSWGFRASAMCNRASETSTVVVPQLRSDIQRVFKKFKKSKEKLTKSE